MEGADTEFNLPFSASPQSRPVPSRSLPIKSQCKRVQSVPGCYSRIRAPRPGPRRRREGGRCPLPPFPRPCPPRRGSGGHHGSLRGGDGGGGAGRLRLSPRTRARGSLRGEAPRLRGQRRPLPTHEGARLPRGSSGGAAAGPGGRSAPPAGALPGRAGPGAEEAGKGGAAAVTEAPGSLGS